MKNIFISQPMREKTAEQICSERNAIISKLKEKFGEIDIVPSYDDRFAKLNPIECLGESIKLLSQADIVVFSKGWENARGCRIEHEVAVAYGKEVSYIEL